MALVSPPSIPLAAGSLPWPFRHHGLTVGLLSFLVLILWRVWTVSHFSLVIGAMELVLLVLCVAWTAWRIMQRWLAKDWSINGFELYVLLLVMLPLGAAFGARHAFGQPVIWGIVAFKDYYLLLGVLAIGHWLRMGWISLHQVEQALVIVAWACLIYFYLATLFINPAPYQDTPLAGANEVKGGGVYYRFNMGAMYFGAIYYTARAFMRARWADLFPAMLFAAYVVVFRLDRTSMAVTAVGMAGVALWHAPYQRIMKVALATLLPAALAVMLLFVLAPAKVEQYKYMFLDAMDTVVGNSGDGTETSIRTVESAIAERQVAKHPWIGNGRISKSWNEDGYDTYFGFFYPADIGALGLVFIYGYPGTALLYLLFPVAFAYMLRVRPEPGDVFFATLQFLLLALFLDSLTNGQLTQNTAQPLLVMALLHFYQRRPAIAGRALHPQVPALRVISANTTRTSGAAS